METSPRAGIELDMAMHYVWEALREYHDDGKVNRKVLALAAAGAEKLLKHFHDLLQKP